MSPYSPKKSMTSAPDEETAILRVCPLHRHVRELEAAGYVKSEVFDKFNEDLYIDNFWSIGPLLALNSNIIDASRAEKISEDTAMILALATLCDHMDSLAPIFNGLTDWWNKQLPTNSTTPGNCASLIATIGEFIAGKLYLFRSGRQHPEKEQ